jgi:hypothetical protein
MFEVLNNARMTGALIAGILLVACNGGGESKRDPAPRPAPARPVLTHIVPAEGPVGTRVTLQGRDLGSTHRVDFPGASATPSRAAATEVEVLVPPGATTGKVTVLTSVGGCEAGILFTVLKPFPVVTGVEPPAAGPGEEVWIHGENLAMAEAVFFGGVKAELVRTDPSGKKLLVKVPQGAVTGRVGVQSDGTVRESSVQLEVTRPQAPAPVLGNPRPASGPAGTEVEVQGGPLDGILAVRVGPVALAPGDFKVEPPDTLRLRIPDLPAGPVHLEMDTAGGTARSGAFTVLAPPPPPPPLDPGPVPAVTALEPRAGAPGTLVMIRGAHLDRVRGVRLGDRELPGALVVDAGTLVLPVGEGQASGPFVLELEGGGALATEAFEVLPGLPPRSVFLGAAFARKRAKPGSYAILHPGGPGFTILDYPTFQRTGLYRSIYYTKAPMFHRYNPYMPNLTPVGGPGGNVRPGMCSGSFATLCLKLPGAFRTVLPPDLLAQAEAWGVAPANLDLFCVSQDMPYRRDAEYLFRPHGWTDPDAPWIDGPGSPYDGNRPVRVRIFDGVGRFHFQGHPANAALTVPVHTHGPGMVLASPGMDPVSNPYLAGLDHTRSGALWTLAFIPSQGRAAATLHLLQNDADQAALDALAATCESPRDLLEGVQASPVLSASPVLPAVQDLFRPVPDRGFLGRAEPGTGLRRFTLTGDGLAGTTALEVGGRLAKVTDRDDHHLSGTVEDPGPGPVTWSLRFGTGGRVDATL